MGNIIPFIQEPKILRFKDFESAKEIIEDELLHFADSLKKIGEMDDADHYMQLLRKICIGGTEPYTDEICFFISDIFWSVDGRPSKYLGEDDIRFLQAVCEYQEGED